MITLNGLELLLPDPLGKLSEWQERFQRLVDRCQFASEPSALRSLRSVTRTDLAYGVGLPRPNWPEAPPPRLNSLWWPTGASRFARGFFLCTGDVMQNLTAANVSAGTDEQPIPLVLQDDTVGIKITAQVYLLAAIPISVSTAASKAENQLWLLPVVDQRYFWQFTSCGDLALTSSTTWPALITALGTALGTEIGYGGIAGQYLNPDAVELYRRYDNAALLLDAIAASVGQRVVVNLDGSAKLSTADAANSLTLGGNQSGGDFWTASAGGVGSLMPLPSAVTVTFPKYRQGVGYCGGEVATYTNNAPGFASVFTVANTIKVIHSSCYADFSSGSMTPDNDSNLSALAQQITNDFYGWARLQPLDKTYNGLKPWSFFGHEDAAEWYFGEDRRPDGRWERVAQTRVQSLPFDFGVEQNNSQDPGLTPLPHFVLGKISGSDLVAGSSGSVDVWDNTPGSETATGVTINNVYTWTTDTIPTGTKVWCLWNCQMNTWYAFKVASSASLTIVRFKLTSSLLSPQAGGTGSASAKIQTWTGATYVDGASITVVDYFAQASTAGAANHPGPFNGPSGYFGFAVQLTDKSEYQILSMEAPAAFVYFTTSGAFSGGGAAATFNSFWQGRSINVAGAVYDVAGLYSSMPSGSKGIAGWDDILQRYQIIDMGRGTGNDPVLFYLDAPLTQGGSAAATIRQWGGAAWAATGAGITVFDSSNLVPAGVTLPTSTLGVCFLSAQSGRYEIIAVPGVAGATIVRFKLTSPLALGGTATADTQVWDAGSSSYVTGVGSVTVVDYFGSLGRRGKFQAPSGRYGYAVVLPDKNEYQILTIEETALFAEFTLDENMGATTAHQANATLDSSHFWYGQDTQGQTVVHDPQDLFASAVDGQKGIAVWDSKRGFYVVVAMSPRSGGVVMFELTATWLKHPGVVDGASSSSAKIVYEQPGGGFVDGAAITVYDFSHNGKFWGSNGARGFASQMVDGDGTEYSVITIDHQYGLLISQATGNTVLTAGLPNVTVTPFQAADGVDSSPSIFLANQTMFPPALRGMAFNDITVGDVVYGELNKNGGTYNVIYADRAAPIIVFKLTAPLTPGNYGASAVQMQWDPGSGNYVTTTKVIIVYDRTEKWKADTGAIGMAVPLPDHNGPAINALDSDAPFYNILWVQEFALFVTAYLTEDMGHTTPGQASATRTGYFQGVDPGASLVAIDVLGIYSSLMTGDAVLLTYDDRTDTYKIVDATQNSSGQPKYARAYAGHTLVGSSPSNAHYVECQAVFDIDGTGYDPSSPHFHVRLPTPSNACDPNVQSGQIIGYQIDPSTNAFCVTDYLDDARGFIKIWAGDSGAIPHGWSLCDGSDGTPNLCGKFVMGARPGGGDGPFDDDGNDDAPGDTGGTRKHTHKPHDPAATSDVSLAVGSSADVNTTATFVGTPDTVTGDVNMTGSPYASGKTDPQPLEVAVVFPGITIEDAHLDIDNTLSVAGTELTGEHVHTVGTWTFSVGTGDNNTVNKGTTAGPVPDDFIDPNPHSHDLSGTVTVDPADHTHAVDIDSTDAGALITPNPHFHTVTKLDINGLTFSPVKISYTPKGKVNVNVDVGIISMIAPNPHNHQTPTLRHDTKYHTPEYYALCYIQRTS